MARSSPWPVYGGGEYAGAPVAADALAADALAADALVGGVPGRAGQGLLRGC
ncbi:hypothetical protein [Streptomyces sp. NPDC088766]|uniref:hypothetical protein n=1 Tax=Streptomyces sp. NPDC088766 TaxID=3365893 RepID=UPI0037F35D07